jgi:hypothetical protein
VKFAAGLWTAQFRAMGSPCEVLVDTPHEQQAQAVAQSVAACALRIDRKFSRYRDDNIVAQINAAGGGLSRRACSTSLPVSSGEPGDSMAAAHCQRIP